jgi:uncharacterized protein involved in exopolysaccharide biosynthesis
LANELSWPQVVKYFMTDHFNAIDYAHQLETAGVPVAQAEVHANALAQVLDSCLAAATDTRSVKSELSYKISELEVTLRAEIREVGTTLRAEINELEARLRAEINEVEAKLRAEINEVEATLRAEIKRVENDLTRRIDRLEERMEERFRSQRFINGVIVTMLVGLYVMMAGLYLR